MPPAGFVYRKPGLRGGAPIHGFSRGAKRLPTQAGPSSSQSQAPQTNNQVVIVTRSEGLIKEINNVTILKKKATGLKAGNTHIVHHRGKVANIINQEDYDDASNTSTISSPGNMSAQPQTLNRNIKRTASENCYTTEMIDEIVVIDSSPDEKQRIMDYDDDNDKSVVGTEVSLSSVAQNMVDVDDVSVIYDGSGYSKMMTAATSGYGKMLSDDSEFNIVSSPLESEVVEEYPLFPCVADYVDDGERHTIDEDKLDVVIESPEEDSKSITIDSSDEDGKLHKNSESPVYLEDMVNLDTNSEEHFATTEEEIMSMNSEIIIMDSNIKTPEDRMHTTSEDFEAMIDSGNSKDGKESNSSIELMEVESEQEITTAIKPTKTVTMPKESLGERTVITVVVPQATSTNSSSTKPQIVSYSRRPITATAIVTKSGVPIYSSSAAAAAAHNLVKDAQPAKYLLGNTTISVPILKNAIPIRTSTKNHAETSNKKINISQQSIIGNISGKKINTSNFVTLSPLNIQHTSGGRIVQAQIVRAQPSTANQKKTEVQITKSLPPTLTYSKLTSLSSLKVTQDVSLPTKIFEDESISPDSSIEQDESDLMLTEETIYTTEDSSNRENNDTLNELNKSSSSSQRSIVSPVSLSNQDRIIEVDEMLNDDWKQKTKPTAITSSSEEMTKTQQHSSEDATKTWSQTSTSQSNERQQDSSDKQKTSVIPVHVIIKSRESSQSPSLPPSTNQRLSSTLPQLSPLSQPNEITSNMANASQQLRSIMSSINQSISSNVSVMATSNQGKTTTTPTTVELKTIETSIPTTSTQLIVQTAVGTKSETSSTITTPTTLENFLSTNRVNITETSNKSDSFEKPKIHNETTGQTITTQKIITTSQAFNQATISPITTTSGGSILVVKQLRTVPSMTSRSRSPVGLNSTNKTQTISVVKSSSGQPAVIISGQAPQQASSVIITQSKLPILTKIQAENAIKSTVNATPVSITVSSASASSAEPTRTTAVTMSILGSTLSQPQQSRIIPYGDDNTILRKHNNILRNIMTTRGNVLTGKVAPIIANSVTSANSTAAIQNILQSSLYSQPLSGSILSATLSQPPQKQNNTLLQTQLSSSNLFRRSKSTDEAPGFLKETPAQIIGKRHSSMEASNTSKDDKDDVLPSITIQKDAEPNTENCKFSTITIVPHKSDDSQNVLLKQLLQNSGSSTTPTPSSLSTIVSRSVTSLRAPALGVVSSLEAQLARPVILPVQPNSIQQKSTSLTSQTTTQTFSIQTNSANKTTIATTVVPSESEQAKNSMRSHQILSRETSFISKAPVTTTDEKDETKNSIAPQVSVSTPQIVTTTVVQPSIPATSTTMNTTVSTVSINVANLTANSTTQNAMPKIIQVETATPTTNIVAQESISKAATSTSEPQVTNVPKTTLTATTTIDNIIKTEPIIVQTQIEAQSAQNTIAPMTKPIIEPNSTVTILQTVIKKEEITQNSSSPTPTSRPPSILSNADVKRELLDDNSQMSAASDHSINKQEPIKEEFNSSESIADSEAAAKIAAAETALEIKRRKRREYQKNRRQMQSQSKEQSNNTGAGTQTTTGKKKARKFSATTKVDEDYDSFIDNLMVQLKMMPAMQILEPTLSRNYSVCPAYGAGDLAKFGLDLDYSINRGDLRNDFGQAELPNTADHYNTKPFGCKSPFTEQHNSSTHYGFYDQEFSPIKFNTDDENRDYLKDRDIETPDTIISSSSPECVIQDSPSHFPGLRLIQEDDEEMSDPQTIKRMSPPIPIIAPVPIRLKKGMSLTTDKNSNMLIEKNTQRDIFGAKSRFGPPLPNAKDKNNVKITLTLTSSTPDDILTVLQDLANILHIPPPKSYQIVERTTTPPSQKLGLYRTRGKDGKEGAPIDIQTILNGNAKFCRHCDVVILNTVIRAKAYEFPLLKQSTNSDLMNESDDLYFCSKSCYKQFKCVPTNILEDKSFETSSNEHSTYDDTVKYSKDANVLLTTATSLSEQNENSVEDENSQDTDIDAEIKSSGQKDGINLINSSEIKTEGKSESTKPNARKLDDSSEDRTPPAKKQKGMQYMKFTPGCFKSPTKFKKMTEKETTEMLFRMNITVTPSPKMPEDTRKCIFCHQIGDGVADGPSRLLNFDVDKWVHLNCALWSDGVYETVNGALMNLENALQMSFVQQCTLCNQFGATIKCFKNRCTNIYHLSCAIKDKCVFYKSKTTHCLAHALKTEKDNELTTLSVQRRVYVERDEARQVASVMHHSELSNLLRVGSLIFLNVGQLLPHQLQNFHTPNFIYPIGYKILRFYWSMRRPNKRCRYICSIADVSGRPEFRVLVQEPNEEDIELRDATPKAIWQRILERLAQMRKEHNLVQIFPKYIIGEDLFGLTEPAVVRILESLPGIETLTDYRFKYGRNPLLELPLAINPSGAARTEPKPQQNLSWKKPHTQRSGSSSQRPTFVASTSVAGEVACPYSKQFVHSKSSQYKKMKQEWRNNVFLAR